ncbi:MAG: hypothetical protein ABFS30_17735, partial [Pseudomonadota bacterium]
GSIDIPDGVPDLYTMNPLWGEVYYLSNLNSSDYKGIVLEFTRRQYRGWEMNGSYTWSESKGDGEDWRQEFGDDRSLLLLEMAAEVRRPVIGEMLAAVGLEGEIVCAATGGTTQYLAEAAGFVEGDDSRLAALAKQENVERVRVIGAYPVPLDGKS